MAFWATDQFYLAVIVVLWTVVLLLACRRRRVDIVSVPEFEMRRVSRSRISGSDSSADTVYTTLADVGLSPQPSDHVRTRLGKSHGPAQGPAKATSPAPVSSRNRRASGDQTAAEDH